MIENYITKFEFPIYEAIPKNNLKYYKDMEDRNNPFSQFRVFHATKNPGVVKIKDLPLEIRKELGLCVRQNKYSKK